MNEVSALAVPADVTDPAATFADFVGAFDLASVPPAVIARAKLSILDALGIGLASSNYEFAKVMADALVELGGVGEFPVIGSSLRLAQRDAAHLNGTLIHGLDFDDTHSESVVHTSASTVPTMLIAGLATRSSGRAAMSAFIIGSECASRIGAAARGGFHDQGFHPTGIVGAFGSALAAGFLYGLNHEQLLDAQGIVLSKAAASLQFLDDGAWTKRNHPGWASVCGQTAVVMAKHGFFGPRAPYLGRFGLYAMHTRQGNEIKSHQLTDGLGELWEMRNIAFKPYPACHLTHAFADAALALQHEYQLKIDEIDRIVAYVHDREIPVICEPVANKIRPRSAYDAQFSVHYVIAATLVHGRFGLAELTDECLADPAILNLCARTSYQSDPNSAYPDYYSGAVDIYTNDGQCHHRREQMHRGSAENPMSESDIKDKFFDNATRTISREQADDVMRHVLELEQQSDLIALSTALTK